MSKTKKGAKKTKFSGDCTIYQAAELHSKIQSTLQASQCVAFDLSNVKKADVSFLQLLAAATLEAQNLCIDLSIKNPPDCVRNLAEDLYFNNIFDNTAVTQLAGGR